jgi:hypothetical protein
MRSLFSKITLAFIVVSLVGAGLAAIIVQQRTRTAFDRFLFDQNIEQVVAILSIYYQSTSSWEAYPASSSKSQSADQMSTILCHTVTCLEIQGTSFAFLMCW